MSAYEDDDREFPVGDLWVDPGGAEVRLPGNEAARIHIDWGQPMVSSEAIADLSATDLSEALSELAEALELGDDWLLAAQSNPFDAHNPEMHRNVAFFPMGDRRIDVLVQMDGLAPDADRAFERAIGDALAPLLERWGARMGRVRHDGPWGEWVTVRLELATAGRRGADILRFAGDVRALLTALRQGPLDLQAARDLVVSGFGGTLVGLREGVWLDAKSSPYRLDVEAQKYELARDVSAFANAQGGMLVIPATTSLGRNGEVIESVSAMDLELIDVRQTRAVLADWVYPAIVGLEVETYETSPGRGQLMIHVPPQPSENWPYVITAAALGERIRRTALTICVRHDADIRHVDAATIHRLLNTGAQREAIRPERVTEDVFRAALPSPLDVLASEAERAGHTVEVDARELRITPPNGKTTVCRYRDLQPITFMLEVHQICETLAVDGLPTHQTVRGFLMPGAEPAP